MKIAVIEDDRPIAQMYEHKLLAAHYDVKVAYDGAAGYDLIKVFKPNLALIDIRLPKMTGDSLLEKVRAEEWGSSLRTIILTNISKDEAPTSLRFLHIDRYIVKAHHTPAQVLAIVNEVLGVKA